MTRVFGFFLALFYWIAVLLILGVFILVIWHLFAEAVNWLFDERWSRDLQSYGWRRSFPWVTLGMVSLVSIIYIHLIDKLSLEFDLLEKLEWLRKLEKK
ncbi:MAG: hypothetical protein IIB64_09990 [Proteobacteria bacterium]|nr:hypothetical protein [Pseudomonadota bacterium]